MTWYSSHPEPHRPTMTSHTSSPGAGGARAAAPITPTKRDADGTTPTLRKPRATRHDPSVSHAQLLAQGPWLGTCLA